MRRFVGAAALLVTMLPVAAAAQVSVEVAPLRVELRAPPGSTNTQAISLTNVSGQAVRVRATLADWYLSKDGSPQFEDPQPGRPYSAAAWLRFAPPEFVIEGHEQATVRFTLNVPADVQPAGYRAGILFDFSRVEARTVERGREVVFKSRIATLIYVHIGDPPVAVELTSLQTRKAGEDTQVVATLKNTGRRSVRTKGNVVLYDMSGRALRTQPLPDIPVLPESERELTVTLDGMTTMPPGDYRIEIKLDVGSPSIIVGETTLKITG